MTAWDDQAIATLRRLRGEGLSYRRIARAMGRSRNSVSQAVYRYVLGLPMGLSYQRDTTKPLGSPKRWTDDYLTERWADRRKSGRERAGQAGATERHGQEA